MSSSSWQSIQQQIITSFAFQNFEATGHDTPEQRAVCMLSWGKEIHTHTTSAQKSPTTAVMPIPALPPTPGRVCKCRTNFLCYKADISFVLGTGTSRVSALRVFFWVAAWSDLGFNLLSRHPKASSRTALPRE